MATATSDNWEFTQSPHNKNWILVDQSGQAAGGQPGGPASSQTRATPQQTANPSQSTVATATKTAPKAQDAGRNARHSDDPTEDKVSRITDVVLTTATLLPLLYSYTDPFAVGGGALFAAIFGNKEIVLLPGKPQLASVLTSPYIKAFCTGAAVLSLPFMTTPASISLGCLMCCRLQRMHRGQG